MKTPITILFVVLTTALSFGQTTRPGADAIRPAKRFPPELMAPAAKSDAAKPRSPGNCAYPSSDRKSLSVKPCEAKPYRLRLLSPLKSAPSPTKPAALP
jgi:hypothetical protein